MMTTLDISSIELQNDASAFVNNDGSLAIVTGPGQWSYSAIFPATQNPSDEFLASIEIEVSKGSVGLLPIDLQGNSESYTDVILRAENGRCTVDIVLPAGRRLCLRNTDPGLQSEARVFLYQTWVRRPVNIDAVLESLLPKMLLNPGLPAKIEIAKGLGISPNEISALLTAKEVIKLNLDAIFDDDLGRFLLREYRDQVDRLSTYDPRNLAVRAGYPGPDYFSGYFRQSITRVHHLVTMLRKLGMENGTLLEVGSLFGTFSGALQKLGYHVTAVDRYLKYADALDGYIDYLRSIGVEVVKTDPDNENSIMDQLSSFDCVISMAVIEHIAHTPQFFLKSLARHVCPGGVLALDTPNIAQYWHRKRLNAGKSIHAEIKEQFYAPIPFEGHHREYTAFEMCWMLEQIGCTDIRCDLFDYNLFQFEELSHDHITSFLAITMDPTLADTILVAGRMPS